MSMKSDGAACQDVAKRVVRGELRVVFAKAFSRSHLPGCGVLMQR